METVALEPTAPTRFAERIESARPDAARAVRVDTLMINVGLRCDLACAHCHQSSSPTRSEVMSRETMLDAMQLADVLHPALIDITGGEPSLWPHLPEAIALARAAGFAIRVRTNLVALTRPECAHLPIFFAENGVALLASLPGINLQDAAEPRGVPFDECVAVLITLAGLGYGAGGVSPVLDLAYNPPLGELPRSEAALTEEFRAALSPLGVRFNHLHVIANVPAGRYARRLRDSGGYELELTRLANAFNPAVLNDLACRHGVEIAWDGTFSDCDFNLGEGLRVVDGPRTLADVFDAVDVTAALAALATRRIAFGPHCYACTAGVGSG